ncbi:thioredoxin [Halobacteriales archaeon QS_8_69_26]|nr:MAG: thioredoxin [Halobacteriales archaeon QS_8_69_26]
MADPETLETFAPNPVWDADAYESTVDTLAALPERGAVRIHVWGGDWCGDCRGALPDFAAAVDAAGLREYVAVHPVDREKEGDLTGEYGVEYIPTVVVEVDGEEVARFVESEPVGIAEYLADELAGRTPETEG